MRSPPSFFPNSTHGALLAHHPAQFGVPLDDQGPNCTITPLCAAAENNRINVLKTLLKAGAGVDVHVKGERCSIHALFTFT